MSDGGSAAPGADDTRARQPNAPTMLDALLPVVVLIALIALTIWLFGISATDGPLQVALLLSAAFAALMALKNGYTSAAVADAAIGGVTTAMSAIFILLAVGALIGTWNMAGTIPTVVDYGVRILNPTIFFLTTAVICALVGIVTGSSWTTAGTLGGRVRRHVQGDGPLRGDRRRRGHPAAPTSATR
jgi:NhaC family Na+:H+ antiporter